MQRALLLASLLILSALVTPVGNARMMPPEPPPVATSFRVVVRVDPQRVGGDAWDPDGSRADVALSLIQAGQHTPLRRRCPNARVCVFPEVRIPAGALFRIEDIDGNERELIGQGPCPTDPAATVRCRLGGARLDITPAGRNNAPRLLRHTELRPLLVGRTMGRSDSGTWTFAATEPFRARILTQRTESGRTFVQAFIATNSVDGSQPASGEISLEVAWRRGRPRVLRLRSTSFRGTRTRNASESNFGTFTLQPGFMPDPHIARGSAGGGVDASTLDPHCVGYISRTPDHLMVADGRFAQLRVMARSAADTTLVIQRPDGSHLCNDDFEMVNPLVSSEMGEGTYRVWVGSYERGRNPHYVLGVSELSSVTPSTLPAPDAPTRP